MRKYVWYFGRIIRHKWFVLLECLKRGLLVRGLCHDLSKFLPSEFIPYARYFYGKNKDDILEDPGDHDVKFARLLHQKRNRHHCQWWVLHLDDGAVEAFDMDSRSTQEMICDWLGAARVQGRGKGMKIISGWDFTHRTIGISNATRRLVEAELCEGGE